MSTKSKMLLVLVAIVILLPTGIFFRFPMARIVMPAEHVGSLLGFTITNTMMATWLSMIVLIVVSVAATRKLQFIPNGIQNLMEAAIEFLLGIVETIAGRENGRRFFPLVATLFFFILVSNWMGLLPGYGTIGVVNTHHKIVQLKTAEVGGLKFAFLMPGAKAVEENTAAEGHSTGADAQAKEEPKGTADHANEEIKAGDGEIYGLIDPYFRSANSDLNNTVAMAIVAMIMIQYFGVRALGGLGYASKFINFKSPIGFFVGILELILEFAKILSFSFRLFGNIFAGEVLLAVMAFLIPWVVSLPFMGLELFVGFIQAVVFSVLVLVFASLAVVGHGEHDDGHGKKAAHEAH